MCGRLLRWTLALAAAGSIAALDASGAGVALRPALGDWEGVGPHGLPLSFVLAKKHRKIVISNLAVGFPLNCPGQPTPFVAVAYKVAEYGGPGAPPRVRLPGWKPTDIVIGGINRGEFPLQIDGRLLAHRRAALSMGLGPGVPKNCGWPRKRVTWRVRPRHRLSVATGTWTGTVTVPNGTGTLTVKVIAAGRIVNLFDVRITCPEGPGGGFTAGPPAEEFIAANGAFEGWGYAHWTGRFGADGALTGTFTSADYCGSSGGQVTGGFTARHAP